MKDNHLNVEVYDHSNCLIPRGLETSISNAYLHSRFVDCRNISNIGRPTE